MTRDLRRVGLGAAAIVLLAVMLLPALPVGAPGPATAPPPPAGPGGSGVRPLILCPPTPPPNPVYGLVDGLYPPSPSILPQVSSGCDLVDQDEVAGSFSSNAAGSGERFVVPVYLPADGPVVTQASLYGEVTVSSVVAGNPASVDRQSYAQIVFTPGSDLWSVSAAVWSLVNDSNFGGSPSEQFSFCPGNSIPMAWNNSYFCEIQENGNFTLGSTIPGGSWVNVTFAGTHGGANGLTVWVNDSTAAGHDANLTFNSTTTGSYAFTPYFGSACNDRCELNWSAPMGEGVGIFPLSYNETALRSAPPLTFGYPRFYQGGGYNGQFYYFVAESSSGACNANAPPGTVATCSLFSMAGNTGYYPYFTFNGSELNFGANWTWTTIAFGGPGFEFPSNAATNDIVPVFFTALSNSSRAGFVPSGAAFQVNATVQTFGTVADVNVTYTVNDGPATVVGMSRVSGTNSSGSYVATIPAGADGLINYTITATSTGGATNQAPSAALVAYHVQRGPLPTFYVLLKTNLQSCGGIRLNGTTYPNGTLVPIQPGYYALFDVGCYPWNFTVWQPSAALYVTPSLTQRTATLEVTANGTLAGQWTYVRPYDRILVRTNLETTGAPCGSVTVGNQTVTNGTTLSILDGLNYSLAPTSCASALFSGWTVVGNLSILDPVLTPHGNGTLTANFVDQSVAVSIGFYTEPSTCGGLLFRGAGYPNGESLSVLAGTYALAPDPCAHYGWRAFQTSGGLSVAATNDSVTVTAAGSITEVNYHLTQVTFVINPGYCGSVLFDGVAYGDGYELTVANNSTHTVAATNVSGCYLVALSSTGGVHLAGGIATVNASGSIVAAFGVGTANQTVVFLTDPPTCGTIYFNNVPYRNTNLTTAGQGVEVPIAATPCNGYGFVRWFTYGNISIAGDHAWLNSSGAIEADFAPVVQLYVFTEPAGCGTVTIDGVAYAQNTSVTLTESVTYALAAVPCAGYRFGSWINTSAVELSGGASLYLISGGFLTAVFLPITYVVTVGTDPAGCGSVRLNGQLAGNGTQLTLVPGAYPLAAVPCAGDHLDRWAVTGGVALNGSQLVVNGSGSVTAYYLPVPPSVSLSVPTSTLVGQGVELIATVAVPIPPFNYSYRWSFGDGAPALTTPVNFTTHTFASTGTFTVSVTVTDPLNRTANDSATVAVVAPSAATAVSLTPIQIGALAFVVVAALAIAAAGLFQRRRAARTPADEEPPTPTAPPSPLEPKP